MAVSLSDTERMMAHLTALQLTLREVPVGNAIAHGPSRDATRVLNVQHTRVTRMLAGLDFLSDGTVSADAVRAHVQTVVDDIFLGAGRRGFCTLASCGAIRMPTIFRASDAWG
jgi:hypothetical protein